MTNSPRSLPPGPGGNALTTRRSFQSLAPVSALQEPAAPPSDWQRVLLAVGRHKWMVLLITALGTLAGIVSTRMLDRQYSAKSIMWIEQSGNSRVNRDRDNIIAAEALIEAPGWLELIKSYTVLDSVVRDLRLYVRPADPSERQVFTDLLAGETVRPGTYRLMVASNGSTFELVDTESDEVLQRGRVGDSVGADLGFIWQPGANVLRAGRKLEFSVASPYEAAQGIVARLKVRADEGGNFLVVQLKDKDPQRAAATVNAITSRLVTVASSMKRQRFEELATILGGQYEVARSRLDSAEVALRNFRVRNAHILGAASFGTAFADPYPNGSRRPGDEPDAAAARASLDRIRTDRAALDQALNATPGTGQVVEALSGVTAAQQSPQLQAALQEAARMQAELRNLRARYTDEAAPVVALRQRLDSLEGSVIPGLARQVQGELSNREVVVRPRVAASMGALRRLPVIALDETRLARDVASAAQLSDEVRSRYESARLALVSSLPDVRVLDRAVAPNRPMASLAPLLVALGFLISLAVAVAIALLRTGLDPKVRYPEQVTQQMRLPILAAMPHVSWRLGEEGSAPVVEALRGLRLRVLQTHIDPGPLVLTITSPAMGEGKSFISSNLALSFADAGYRTILVDGDVRRGAQHLALDAQQRPGLTDVLSGKAQLTAAVQDTGFPGLQLVAAGSRMHRAPELLLSPRLKAVMEQLRGMADVIIVDSPPLAAGVDPVALGTVTGSLMLVLRQGTTDMPMAMSKLDLLDQFQIRTIGAVLNDVPERGAFKYYTYEPDESEFLPSGDDDGSDRKRPPILAGKGPDA